MERGGQREYIALEMESSVENISPEAESKNSGMPIVIRQRMGVKRAKKLCSDT